MAKQGNARIFSTLGLYFFLYIVVLILFPHRLEKEMYMMVGSVNKVTQPQSNLQADYPYAFKKYLGFLDTEGHPVSAIPVKKNFSISEVGYFNYDDNKKAHFYRSNNDLLFEFKGNGYPFIIKDRIFAVQGQGGSLSEYGLEGQLIWHKDFLGILTVAKVKGDFLAAGFSNGEFHLLDSHGRREYSFEPGGSRLPVILGIDYGYLSNSIATVSGIEPQRMVLYEKKKEKYRPVFHYDLQSNFRREVFLQYSQNEEYLFIENQNKLDVLDTEKRMVKSIQVSGKIYSVEYLADYHMFYLVCKERDQVSVQFLTTELKTLAHFSFRADDFFLHNQMNHFVWGIEDIFYSTTWIRG